MTPNPSALPVEATPFSAWLAVPAADADSETAPPVNSETAPRSDSATDGAENSATVRRRDRPRPGNQRATYHLPGGLVQQIDALCRATGRPKGDTVAEALAAYLNQWELAADPDELAAYQAILRGGS